MPYIVEELRDILDPAIKDLGARIRSAAEVVGQESIGGILNYTLTRLLDDTNPGRYAEFERLIGMLECCKTELYRRMIAPYEDEKIEQNGDVY